MYEHDKIRDGIKGSLKSRVSPMCIFFRIVRDTNPRKKSYSSKYLVESVRYSFLNFDIDSCVVFSMVVLMMMWLNNPIENDIFSNDLVENFAAFYLKIIITYVG